MDRMAPPAARTLRALSVLCLLALGACSRAVVGTPTARVPLGTEETGSASWYGTAHHGRRTASGEVYDMRDLTAAHRTLPLGTRLMVTNLNSGESVEVRVNDRGPFVDGRILDLSYGAARVLGAVGPGVIPVRLRVIALPGAMPAGTGTAAGGFTVQVGAFSNRSRAEALRDAIGSDATITETIVSGETWYRVRVGAFSDRAAAVTAAQRLAARGYRAVVVER